MSKLVTDVDLAYDFPAVQQAVTRQTTCRELVHIAHAYVALYDVITAAAWSWENTPEDIKDAIGELELQLTNTSRLYVDQSTEYRELLRKAD